jgi:hypothetical protein
MTAFPEFAIPADVRQERVSRFRLRRHCTYLSGYVVRLLSVQRANAKRSTWQGTRAFTRERKSSYELGAGDF